MFLYVAIARQTTSSQALLPQLSTPTVPSRAGWGLATPPSTHWFMFTCATFWRFLLVHFQNKQTKYLFSNLLIVLHPPSWTQPLAAAYSQMTALSTGKSTTPTSNGSWRQGIKGEMTCTVYVALVWNNIIKWPGHESDHPMNMTLMVTP